MPVGPATKGKMNPMTTTDYPHVCGVASGWKPTWKKEMGIIPMPVGVCASEEVVDADGVGLSPCLWGLPRFGVGILRSQWIILTSAGSVCSPW